MDSYLMSLLAALATQVTTLAKVVEDLQLAFARVMGHVDGDVFSEAVNSTEERKRLPPPSTKTFSRKEYALMTESVRLLVKDKMIKAHLRVRKDGLFEVRAQLDKKVYTGAGKTEAEATQKFIICMNKGLDNRPPKTPVLSEYATSWLEVIKKPNLKERTYNTYLYQFRSYIFPAFDKKEIGQVTSFEIQKFLNDLCDKNNFRTAKQLWALLHALFEYAVADDVIRSSPMKKIEAPKFESAECKPLTREEERGFIQRFKEHPGDKYYQAYAFILYTGLRRSELASVTIEDGFVHVQCAKCRQGKKQKVRLIPITPMLERVLPMIDLPAIKSISGPRLSMGLVKCIDNHHLHELRHTFITRCQECGVRREIVSVWAGHAADNSVTTAVYTHLEQNLDLHKEAAKLVDYEL